MYAKLIDGAFIRAPHKLRIGSNIVYNPTPDQLTAAGYKPVTYTDAPDDAPEGQHYEPGWTETETAIVQTWRLEDDPPEELTAEEIATAIEEALA